MGFINIIVLVISFYGCFGGNVPYSNCEAGKVITTKCGPCFCDAATGYWGPWQTCIGICDEEGSEAMHLLENNQLEDQFRQAEERMGKIDVRTRTKIPHSLYPSAASAPISNNIQVQQDYDERSQPSYKKKPAAKSLYSGPVIEYEPEYNVLDY